MLYLIMMMFILVQGTNSDELDIVENEQLELAAESEGDGWLRVSSIINNMSCRL